MKSSDFLKQLDCEIGTGLICEADTAKKLPIDLVDTTKSDIEMIHAYIDEVSPDFNTKEQIARFIHNTQVNNINLEAILKSE